MALDRKIRIGLQVSELLADPSYEGEDVEVRQEMGRAELRKNFDMLVRGRDRPNGILGEGEELSAPDTLVKGTYFSDSDFLSLDGPPPLLRCSSSKDQARNPLPPSWSEYPKAQLATHTGSRHLFLVSTFLF